MTGYVVRRLLQGVVVVLGVTLLTFVLENLVASGPHLARAIIGPKATPAQIASFVRSYGLDRSLPVQYWAFLDKLVHGNLGYSYKLNRSVDSIVATGLPRDAVLVVPATVLSLVIGVPVGVAQARRRNGVVDLAATGAAFVLYSMPSFWLGLLLVDVFAVVTGLLPDQAPQGATIGQVLSDPVALILPVLTLTLTSVALYSRYARSSVIEQLAQSYVRTARAKGLSERLVCWRHVVRNALGPIVTLVGLSLPAVFTGALITEFIFNFPGNGLAFYNAAISYDYPVELGIAFLVGLATVVGNLLADIGYAVLDPRIRLGKA